MLYYNNPKNYEWFRIRGPFSFIVKKEIGAVKSILGMLHYREVLDVGCGTGIYSRIFPGDKNYTGLEPDKRMYEFCRSKKINCYRKSVEEFNTCEKFDVILFSGSFEFIKNKKAVLKKCSSLLNKNGKIIIVTPRRNLFGWLFKLFHKTIGNSLILIDEDHFNSLDLRLVSKQNANFLVTVFVYEPCARD